MGKKTQRNPVAQSPYLRKCHRHKARKSNERQTVKAQLRMRPEAFAVTPLG